MKSEVFPWPDGVILNCARMDVLIERASEGDPDAVRILMAIARPLDVPRRVLNGERDRRVLEISAWLRSKLVSSRRHRRAAIIAGAAEMREGGRSLNAMPLLNRLDQQEREELSAMVDQVLWWAPEAGHRGRGLSLKAISAILAAESSDDDVITSCEIEKEST